ncbi:MAG TPA: hypothetical protein VFZ83_08850 [Acidimicrobiia bacterium]|nr:hypothetical protein [Acidimicrobiia bacterium]
MAEPSPDAQVLHAGDGLQVVIEPSGTVRIAWGEPDWFGPGRVSIAPRDAVTIAVSEARDALHDGRRFSECTLAVVGSPIVASVRAAEHEPVVVFRLEATDALNGLATGQFADPSVMWPQFDPAARLPDGVPAGARGFGHQYTEFALPTTSDASLAGWFLFPPRPPVVEPLALVAPDGRCLLLAPLDRFHDQVIAVPRDREHAHDGVRCGWHGDLDDVPAGFATELALVAGRGMRECLERWASLVRARHGTVRLPRDGDALARRLSYWTDNGAAYWYKTEPGLDTPATLAATVADLRERAIPVHAVQLDSWWYPHDALRPFDTDAWDVPPTGLVRWEPRDDVLPDGIAALRARLGDPPLVAHSRHFASSSPYFEQLEAWIDGDRAHPVGPALYERLADQCVAWGIETFEHDWLIECFLGVRGLRAQPGRAAAWQEALDTTLAARGLTAQWCMASPADFFETARLRRVTSIRTCGDHGYLIGPGDLWAWFLLTNALARALGLFPFKDVFLSGGGGGSASPDAEAALAALSAGPVGIGDGLGRANRDVVLRTCRADGVLVRPDVAIAAADRCFLEHPIARHAPLVGTTHTDHTVGRTGYAFVANAHGRDDVTGSVTRADLGDDQPAGDAVVYDWRTGELGRAPDEWPVAFPPLEWQLRVLAPIGPAGVAIVGDVSKYATAGDARIAAIEADGAATRVTVLGAGERVTVTGWADHAVTTVGTWPAGAGVPQLAVRADGRFDVTVDVPDTGWIDVTIR